VENRSAPHARPLAHNIERFSPRKQNATVAEMNGVAMLRNSGPSHEPCEDVDPMSDYENVLTD